MRAGPTSERGARATRATEILLSDAQLHERLRARLGPRVALALGGGAARGFAHIGVVRVLEEAGIEVACVTGTSIGSVVGAAVAAGRLDAYEADVRRLRGRDLARLLDPRPLGGGLFAGRRLLSRVEAVLGSPRIEDLALPYQAVAVDLGSGEEVRLNSGPLLEAMRASCAIPGLLHPVEREGRWLVDGGLASPLPLAAARAQSQLPLVAVDLNGLPAPEKGSSQGAPAERPGLVAALGGGIAVLCAHLTRAAVAADPPELLVVPDLHDQGLFDLGSVAELIERGRRAVAAAMGG
ncbi:MAG: patatin-like phospholipase family protein [Planctomycetes bacterium]|nr:patatin-like phospholipase family protein [Planctomycetota bacterium]